MHGQQNIKTANTFAQKQKESIGRLSELNGSISFGFALFFTTKEKDRCLRNGCH